MSERERGATEQPTAATPTQRAAGPAGPGNRPPQRIVSLVGSNTEIVAALGLGDRLVGVDDFSDYPAWVAALPRVGRDLEIDLDRVAALQPDLVLASLSVPGMERNVAGLRERGLPHLVLQGQGLAGVYADIATIAAACGVPERGRALVARMEAEFAATARAVAACPHRPTVYWEWWPRPPITPGRPSWVTEQIAIAGGTNLFADLERESAPVDPAEVARRDPEVIVLCYCGARRLPDPRSVAQRPGWSAVRAVRAGRVYALLEPHFGRPGPRLTAGARELAALLHPCCLGRGQSGGAPGPLARPQSRQGAPPQIAQQAARGPRGDAP